jgi:D-alanyl-D-alanine carboxypeptidase
MALTDEDTMGTEIAAALGRALPPLAAAGGWPGVVVAFRSGDAVVEWAIGDFDRETTRPLEPGNAFRIASVTKAFTAVAMLRAVDSGLLVLDAPIERYLGAWPDDSRRLVERVTGGRPLTLRQLLGHTAGVRDYFSDPEFSARALAGSAGHWEPLELLALAARIGPPLFQPGEGFSYGDTGYVLAGLLLEQLLGLPLSAIYRREILDPLGLQSTFLEGREPGRVAALSHHYLAERDLTPIDMSFDWAGGGLVSTAADLARFSAALFEGEFLPAKLLEELTRWEPKTHFPTGGTASYDRYGLGVGTINAGGIDLVGATGVWGGFMFWVPEWRAALAGTVNLGRVNRRPLLDAIVEALRPLIRSGRNRCTHHDASAPRPNES